MTNYFDLRKIPFIFPSSDEHYDPEEPDEGFEKNLEEEIDE